MSLLMRSFRPRPPRSDSGDLLSRDEEGRLARAWRDNRDFKAREKIIEAYQKMAVSLAMKASRSGLPIDDLVQEASLGLMAALDRFDPDRGNGFGTFARYHVISRLQIYTLENVAPLRIFNTAATKSLLARYGRMRRQWEAKASRQIDAEGRAEICRDMGVSEEQLRRFEMAVAVPTAVDVGAGFQEDDAQRSHQLADPSPGVDETVLGRIARGQTGALLSAALASLPQRDADILKARHLRETPMTLDALSQQLGVSRERVRQIELRSLKKLADFFAEHGITSLRDLMLDDQG